jgi:hypothetical protein
VYTDTVLDAKRYALTPDAMYDGICITGEVYDAHVQILRAFEERVTGSFATAMVATGRRQDDRVLHEAWVALCRSDCLRQGVDD